MNPQFIEAIRSACEFVIAFVVLIALIAVLVICAYWIGDTTIEVIGDL